MIPCINKLQAVFFLNDNSWGRKRRNTIFFLSWAWLYSHNYIKNLLSKYFGLFDRNWIEDITIVNGTLTTIYLSRNRNTVNTTKRNTVSYIYREGYRNLVHLRWKSLRQKLQPLTIVIKSCFLCMTRFLEPPQYILTKFFSL